MGGQSRPYHRPVLVREVTQALVLVEGGVYFDGTLGEGGHSAALLDAEPQPGLVIGADLDPSSLETAQARLDRFGDRFAGVNGNYADMADLTGRCGVDQADGVLLDLGFSSRQVERPAYGLSFQADAPLDMRYDPAALLDAGRIVNTYDESELVGLLRRFGEEPRARAIAGSIVRNRPIDSTADLARLVENTVGRRPGSRIHPATRTFQALRIAVNDELTNLERGLEAAVGLLRPGGRLAVISYHSLEDRIVKSFMQREAASCLCPPGLPVCICGHQPSLGIVNRRIIRPSADEVDANPRSRSAKLRIAQRIHTPGGVPTEGV